MIHILAHMVVLGRKQCIHGLRTLALGALMMLGSHGLRAQAGAVLPEVGMDLNFNHTDVMLGGHAGVCIPGINASASATFKGRIGSKRVLIETEEPNVLVQYRERRYLLGLQAEKRLLLNQFDADVNFGGFLGGFGGLSFGDYRGTKDSGPARLAGSLMAGVYLSDPESVILKLGYMYLPMQTQNVFNHRIVFSISILLS